jgi:dephospho-CoA kinase
MLARPNRTTPWPNLSVFSVGLTGGIGSGKNVVAQHFAEHGIPVIDTDRIAHTLTAVGGIALPLIRAQFGSSFIKNGALARAKMRQAIFSDPDMRLRLEAILHPLIDLECVQLAQSIHSPYLIFMVPLLIETGIWKNRVQRVLVVDCSVEKQMHRVQQRNGFSEAMVRAILAQQVDRSTRLAQADDVLHNDHSLAELYPQIDWLHTHYLHLSETFQPKPC